MLCTGTIVVWVMVLMYTTHMGRFHSEYYNFLTKRVFRSEKNFYADIRYIVTDIWARGGA